MASVRETFFNVHFPNCPDEVVAGQKAMSAYNAKDYNQLLGLVKSWGVADWSKTIPLTKPEEWIAEFCNTLESEFDGTKNDNTIWSLIDHLHAEEDNEDEMKVIMLKLGIDPAKADSQDAAGYKKKIKSDSFQAVVNLSKKCAPLLIDGVRFKAFYNYTSKDDILWSHFVNGRAIWLVADDATFDFNAWRHFSDQVRSMKAKDQEILDLVKQITALKGQVGQKSDPAKDNTIKQLKEEVAKLKAEVDAISGAKMWTKVQKNELKPIIAELEAGWKCCYPDDAECFTRLLGQMIEMFEMRGDECFEEVKALLLREKARWTEGPHVDGVKNEAQCKIFDMTQGYSTEISDLFLKWAVPGATSKTKKNPGSSKKSWHSALTGPITDWWQKRRAMNRKVSALNAEVGKSSWIGQYYQNWWTFLKGPMRAMAKESADFGAMSYTVGLLGSVLLAPFALIGAVANGLGDGVAKLATGATLTKRWNGNWFGAPKSSK